MVDWRLLEEEEGVCVRCCPGDLPGDRAWLIVRCCPLSGVIDDVGMSPGCCRDETCSDFALAARVTLVGSVVVFMFALRVPRRLLFWLSDGVRPSRPCILSFVNRGTSWRTSMPGPTDFRGALAAGFGGACAGNWLCRRVRTATLVAGGGIMEEASKGRALVYGGLVGFWDWLKRRRSEVLRAGCASAGAGVNVLVCGGGPMVL